MRAFRRLRVSLWITNVALAVLAVWMVWTLTRPPEHALAPKAPPQQGEKAAKAPVRLAPIEVVADPIEHRAQRHARSSARSAR